MNMTRDSRSVIEMLTSDEILRNIYDDVFDYTKHINLLRRFSSPKRDFVIYSAQQ